MIRLSELSRYVRTMGTSGGPRPRKPVELDWRLLRALPPTPGDGQDEALPAGIADRWLSVTQAARLAGRTRSQILTTLGRGLLVGRRVRKPRQRQSRWEIRLSELDRYLRWSAQASRRGYRPLRPTELDWALLSTFPPPAPDGEQAA